RSRDVGDRPHEADLRVEAQSVDFPPQPLAVVLPLHPIELHAPLRMQSSDARERLDQQVLPLLREADARHAYDEPFADGLRGERLELRHWVRYDSYLALQALGKGASEGLELQD